MTGTAIRFIFILFITTAYGFKFTDLFKACGLQDSHLDECLKEAIYSGFKAIGATGIPAINLPAIEPISVDKIKIGSGTTAVQLDQFYYNVKSYGFADLTVINAHYDPQKKLLQFTAKHPVLRQEGEYELKGKILVIPVYGKGDSVITLKNAVIEHIIQFEEEKKNGKTYFKIISFKSSISVGGGSFLFKNLYDGNKQLSDNIHKVVNENWEVLLNDIKPNLNAAYSDIFFKIAKVLFENIPADDIFIK